MEKLLGRSFLCIGIVCVFVLVSLPSHSNSAHAAPLAQSQQTPDLFFNELQVVYLTNLKRREAGLAPLRWNREISEAARWFAQNSVDGRNGSYCGHADTEERSPGERLLAFNYTNAQSWGENVVCGLAAPEAAINGWMNSAPHKQNILQSTYREIGVGYYRNPTNGRGYLVQDFSYDPEYAPVIINNEAPQSTAAEVQLYIYNPVAQNGLEGMGDAVEMMIANDPSFANAAWEPFAPERNWTMAAGEGWRTVYVKTRDAQGRTSLVSDTIYLGATLPRESLSLEHASTIKRELDFYNLDKSGWPLVQLSVNWQGDDSDALFEPITGNGQEISESDAIGGTVLKMSAGRPSHARYWTTEFYKNVEFTAYVRLKVSDNQSPDEVLSLKIEGGGVTYGPLVIKGTDFAQANSYQEFSLPFTFNENSTQPYLTFNLYSSGKSTVFVDTITIYTALMRSQTHLSWPVLGGYHRSRGIWGRFVDDTGNFSNATELIPDIENVLPEAPPINTQPIVPTYQILLPVAIK
jgi:uncharacterized protein YkwD